MKFLHLQFCLLAVMLASLGGVARGGAVIEGDPADAGVFANAVNSGVEDSYDNNWLTQAVGQQDDSGVGNIVEPFALPYLAPGQTVTSATLTFYLDRTASPTAKVQLYGLTRVSTTNAAAFATDWYVGRNDPANTLLTGAFATPSTATKSTVTYSGENLTSFIQKQYANPAFANSSMSSTNYIFFRLSPDSGGDSVGNYLFGTSRNPNRLYHPTLALTISGGISNLDGRLQFSFNLPRQSVTSAGVYNPSTGVLIRTLWNNIQYGAGMNYGAWDGNDDSGHPVAGGTSYQIKLIYHNVQYIWAGTVGNTSANQSGDNLYKGFLPLFDMSIAGGKAYYAVSYNEGQNCFRYFTVGQPQVTNEMQVGFCDAFSSFNYVAADPTRSYWAKVDGGQGVNETYIVGVNNADGSIYTFPQGTTPTGANQKYPSCVDFDATAKPSPAGGLAVQQSGNDLFVSHPNLNVVRVFDKVRGTPLGSFAVTAPGRMAVTANGDVWVISNAATPVVSRYNFAHGEATLDERITGLVNPVGVGVSADDALVLVTDGGSSQQIKAFHNATAAPAWTYGQLGGYPVLGPALNSSTFDFQDNSFVAFQADNTFWVMDTGNQRYLHFSISGSKVSYIEQIAWLEHSYANAVDYTDATRVYNLFFGYSVNYNLPIGGTNGSWALTHNWRYGLPNDSAHQYFGFAEGIKNVVTLPNGRVYALIDNRATWRMDLFELPPIGPARLTGDSFEYSPRIYADGSLRFTVPTPNSLSFYSAALTGFDSNNNPIWATPSLLASSADGAADPKPWGPYAERTEVTSGGMIVDFDGNHADTGYHIGAVPIGGHAWAWRSGKSTTSSYTGWFPRNGQFDIGNGVQYAGNVDMAMGRNIVCGYHGEFWKDGEASQWLNYYDNGLLVGIFGSFQYDRDAHGQDSVDGYCGNSFTPDMAHAPDGNIYLYMNDENDHGGSARWKITGWDNIIELKGTASIGGTVSLSGGVGAPAVLITSPPRGTVFDNSPSIMVAAEASGSGASVASVQFFDGSTSLGRATSAPYSITTAALTPGRHTLTATATDTAGHSTTSPAVTIRIGSEAARTPPPAPAKLTVTRSTSNSVSLGWTEPLIGTASSTTGQIISLQCTSDRSGQALSPSTMAGAPGYAVANWNILGQSNSNGLIFANPLNSAGTVISNLGVNLAVAAGTTGGPVSSLPGTGRQLFANTISTASSSDPGLSLEFVPFAKYDLVVYSLANASFPATTSVTVSDAAHKSVVKQTFTRQPTVYTTSTVGYGSNASVTNVNTIIFSGVTCSTIEIQGHNIAAVQIVERPYDSGTPKSFNILRATGSGAFRVVGTTSGTTPSYTDSSVAAGTTYRYRVRAVNSVGLSVASNTVSATAAAR